MIYVVLAAYVLVLVARAGQRDELCWQQREESASRIGYDNTITEQPRPARDRLR
jgi:hypothetical protein